MAPERVTYGTSSAASANDNEDLGSIHEFQFQKFKHAAAYPRHGSFCLVLRCFWLRVRHDASAENSMPPGLFHGVRRVALCRPAFAPLAPDQTGAARQRSLCNW